jgi:hypothetical protein
LSAPGAPGRLGGPSGLIVGFHGGGTGVEAFAVRAGQDPGELVDRAGEGIQVRTPFPARASRAFYVPFLRGRRSGGRPDNVSQVLAGRNRWQVRAQPQPLEEEDDRCGDRTVSDVVEGVVPASGDADELGPRSRGISGAGDG